MEIPASQLLFLLNLTQLAETMKSTTPFFLAAGFILWGMSSCSSTTTETTDTAVITETVTPNMAATDTGTTRSATVTDTLASSGSLSDDPTNFVLLAGSLDLLQTRTSNQAVAKATNPEVKKYAQEVLSEHTNVSRELRGLAATNKLKYPTDLLAKHQLMMNRLMEERAKDFDKTYMEVQEASHKELEELFEDASKRHADPEMKEFASRSLPTLRTQLDRTKKVKDIVD